MRIKELRKLPKSKWYLLCDTVSNSNNWGFDRLRLYYPNGITMAGVFTENIGFDNDDSREGALVIPDSLVPVQFSKFSSDNEFEHDFGFDLSFNTSNARVYIGICEIPRDSEFTQVYAYPTGFSETWNRSADLYSFQLKICNPENFLRLENQANLLYVYVPDSGIVNADFVRLDGTKIVSDHIDDIIIGCSLNGKINGELNYSNNLSGNTPTVASRSAYDSLISKGWTITGTAPPTV